MARLHAMLIVLLVALSALAGCVHLTGDEEGEEGQAGADEQGAMDEEPQSATLSGNITMTSPEDGNGTQGDEGDEGNETGNGTTEAQGVSNATVFLNATAGNETAHGNGTGGGNDTQEGNASSLETTADEGGAYHFENVTPGEYVLQVVAQCCVTNNTTVVLEPGENATLDVELTAMGEGPAYRLVEEKTEGEIMCSVPGLAACGLVDDFLYEFAVEADLESIVVAVLWDEDESTVAGNFRVLLEEGDNAYLTLEGGSPLEGRTDGEIEGPADLQFRIFTEGTDVIVQQSYTIHYHMFYDAPAPEGYSAVPDGEEPEG